MAGALRSYLDENSNTARYCGNLRPRLDRYVDDWHRLSSQSNHGSQRRLPARDLSIGLYLSDPQLFDLGNSDFMG